MGDEFTQQGQSSSENFPGRRRESLGQPNKQPTGQPNMEFEGYPQHHFPVDQYGGGTTMAMRSLAAALPDYSVPQYQQQPFQQQFLTQGSSNQNMIYQYQQGQQFAGQTGTNYNPNVGQYHSQFMQQPTSRPQQGGYGGYQTVPTTSHPFQSQNLQMQPDFSHNQPQQFLQIPSGQYVPTYGSRVSSGFQQPQMRSSSNMAANPGMSVYQQLVPQPVRRTSSNSSLQGSAIRGPPRKPKQSGHALWVGNLPPGTHIMDLKDHFARDATKDIESVFLISKSNCAFVNYRTEFSCAAAMSRFHDSRFQGVRLVCRLRRGSASAASATQPSPVTAPLPSTAAHAFTVPKAEDTSAMEPLVVEEVTKPESAGDSVEKVPEKFFVVKSLTIEDLERSVQTGVWATQAHNEDALNEAYQTADSVYLIFSANKSGEYFGYARMDSAIDDEAAAKIEVPSRPASSDAAVPDLPLTIPTHATATAPKGRIIDDSSRGTIFWEADNDEKDEPKEEELGDASGYESAASAGTSPVLSQAFGKPFKIVWVSTERLPFYRTRGLRNPWNANREVKIARDGTEIEPGVGRRLIAMFHRPQMVSTSASSHQPSGRHPMAGSYMGQPSQMPGNPYGRMFHQN